MTCLFSPAERCAVHGSVTETAPLFPGDNLDNKLLPHQRLQKGQDLQASQGNGTDPIHSQEPSDRGLTGPCRACSSNSLEQTAGRSSACQCSIALSLPLVSVQQSHSTSPFRSTRLSSRSQGASSLKCAPLPTRARRILIWDVFAKWTFLFCSLRLTSCSTKWHCAFDNQVSVSQKDDSPVRQTH